MENFEGENFENGEKKEKTEKNFESLRREIAELKRIEEKKKELEEPYVAHFRDLNPDDLAKDDLNIYQKFVSKDLKSKEFEEYRNGLRSLAKDPQSDSKKAFSAWIANKLSSLENMEWYDPKSYAYLSERNISKEENPEEK